MKIKEITLQVRELRNLGNYEHKEYVIGYIVQVDENENAIEVLQRLWDKLNFIIKKWLAEDKESRKIEKLNQYPPPPFTTPSFTTWTQSTATSASNQTQPTNSITFLCSCGGTLKFPNLNIPQSTICDGCGRRITIS
jgi:hypothetical protein